MDKLSGVKIGKTIIGILACGIVITGGTLTVLGIQGKLFPVEPKPTIPKKEEPVQVPKTASKDKESELGQEESAATTQENNSLEWTIGNKKVSNVALSIVSQANSNQTDIEDSGQPDSSSQLEEPSVQPEQPNSTEQNDNPVQLEYLHELDLHEDGIIYMQDVTQEMVDEMGYGDIVSLIDRRTGNEYEAVKLEDGSWGTSLYMTTDLKLGSAEKPMLLTSKNTSVYSDYILPKSSAPKAYDKNAPIEEALTIDGDSYLYSPAAAVAGSQIEDFGDNTVIYNTNESICPKGWRLPMSSEDYDRTDGQTESDFNSEVWRLTSWVQDQTGDYDQNLLFATSTSAYSYDWDDENQVHVPLGLTMNETPYNSSSIMQVRCMFGEPRVRRLNLTIDFNGGYVTERDINWELHNFTKIDYYKTWISDSEDAFLPSYWITRDGYEFLGYSKNKNATTPEYYDDGTWSATSGHFMKISDYLGNAHSTVYAIWEKKVLITFDANGGEFYTGSNQNLATIDPLENTWITSGYIEPYYSGHELLGWATSNDATEPEYYTYPEEGQKSFNEITEDTILYAVWN